MTTTIQTITAVQLTADVDAVDLIATREELETLAPEDEAVVYDTADNPLRVEDMSAAQAIAEINAETQGGARMSRREVCQWWHLCRRAATTTRRTPWGDVPICDRCAHRVDEMRTPSGKRARESA